MTNQGTDSTMRTQKSLGERFEAIADRMDAAYAERRKHKPGSSGYKAADEGIEAVYTDLRLLNAEMKGVHFTNAPCWCDPTIEHVS